jgi:hypothetical protein
MQRKVMPIRDTARPAKPWGSVPAEPGTAAHARPGGPPRHADPPGQASPPRQARPPGHTSPPGHASPSGRTRPRGQARLAGTAAARGARFADQAAGLPGRIPPRWRAPLAAYLVCQLIFLGWWAAFYPAILSFDSVSYVIHVTTGPWVGDHSVLYDSMVWLSLHATGGLAALTLAQTVAISAALAYTVAAFGRLGIPGRWTAIAAVIVAALPPTGVFMVYLWKDVPYVICGYLVVPTLAHLLSLRGQPGWHRSRRANELIAALGLELLGMSLFRLNGFTIVVLAAVPLVGLLRGARGKIAAAALAAVCLALLLNLVAYPAAGIKRPPASLGYGPALSDLAVVYAKRPSAFTHADKALMARAAPLARWKKSADCFDSDPTTRVPGIRAHAKALSSQLLALWQRVLTSQPQLVLDARICRSSIAWNIFQSSKRGRTYIQGTRPPGSVWPKIRHNPYRTAMFSRPLSATLHQLANSLWNASRTRQLDWLLFRGAFWAYLSYLVLLALARARRDWAFLSLGAVAAAQQLGLIPELPAQDYRYMMVEIFTGIMLVPLFFGRKRRAPAAESS